MYWRREGDHNLLRQAVYILPAIPENKEKENKTNIQDFLFTKNYKRDYLIQKW